MKDHEFENERVALLSVPAPNQILHLLSKPGLSIPMIGWIIARTKTVVPMIAWFDPEKTPFLSTKIKMNATSVRTGTSINIARWTWNHCFPIEWPSKTVLIIAEAVILKLVKVIGSSKVSEALSLGVTQSQIKEHTRWVRKDPKQGTSRLHALL